jgi:hypothetical protein
MCGYKKCSHGARAKPKPKAGAKKKGKGGRR